MRLVFFRSWSFTLGLLASAFILAALTPANASADPPMPMEPPIGSPAPELEGGTAWLNSAGPLTIHKDLKGKIILLDFWTLCCINCMHILPDLAKLEKKYANQLVVIGVHSAKFENERDTNSIRKAILRYEISHPVVNDADHKLWTRYGANWWPTFVLIDPEGRYLGHMNGEGNYAKLDKYIGSLVSQYRRKKTLDEKPRFDLVRYREKGDTPLFFPGKVLADEKSDRLFIADSTHHRIVIADLAGKVQGVVGVGTPGRKDGAWASAQFDDPQGMALKGNILYVADRRNHLIRAVNLKTKTVATVAGTGVQGVGFAARGLTHPVGAKTIPLNSPWDLLLSNSGNELFIAMAGHHQIWVFDLNRLSLKPYAGTGEENIGDGSHATAKFAQPSGLTTDGQNLYVADSEISSIRQVGLGYQGAVKTLVGRGLFNFGDRDGPGQVENTTERERKEALIQHPLGVAYHDGKVYVADTYNSKIRVIDVKTGEVSTFAGNGDKSEDRAFYEPGGISYAAGKLYIADTNANRIRTVDLATKKIATLPLEGLSPPTLPKK